MYVWIEQLERSIHILSLHTPITLVFILCVRNFRYKVGQRFGRHIDESVHLEDGKRTHYTLLIYLSGGVAKGKNDRKNVKDSSSEPLVGGETVFYCSRNSVVAEVNLLTFVFLFVSPFLLCVLHCTLLLEAPSALALVLWSYLRILIIPFTWHEICRWRRQKEWLFCTFMGTNVCCMKRGMLVRASSMFSDQM